MAQRFFHTLLTDERNQGKYQDETQITIWWENTDTLNRFLKIKFSNAFLMPAKC
jgi:type VI protein secretion system component Hcp